MNDRDLCNLLRRFRGAVGDMEVAREAAERIESLVSQQPAEEADSDDENAPQSYARPACRYTH